MAGAIILAAATAAAPPRHETLTAAEASVSVEQSEQHQGSEDAPADESATPSYQAFSTLAALALGVLGLLWVRRRAAAQL